MPSTICRWCRRLCDGGQSGLCAPCRSTRRPLSLRGIPTPDDELTGEEYTRDGLFLRMRAKFDERAILGALR